MDVSRREVGPTVGGWGEIAAELGVGAQGPGLDAQARPFLIRLASCHLPCRMGRSCR